MSFKDIVGQEDAKSLLSKAIINNKISHAYIISGEEDSGKKMLAEAFATMLLCENRVEEDSCGECHSCKQSKSHNNPDIIYVEREIDEKTHEKKRELGVNVIREQINNNIVLKPYGEKYKIYIVDEAHKMNQQAQNALLKTIEEPPEYAIIILLTDNHNSFLQTILSRCVLIETKPVARDQIVKYLMNKCAVVDYQAQVVASFAQGNLGKAIKLTSDEDFNQLKGQMLSVVKRMGRVNEFDISETVKNLKEYKSSMDKYLDLLTLWYKDVLLYKATLKETGILFAEDSFEVKSQAADISYAGLNNIMASIEDARAKFRANVNLELMIEQLLHAIKENIS